MFSFASVYISKEIIQAKDRGKYTTAEIENHLIKALIKPTGKDRGGLKLLIFILCRCSFLLNIYLCDIFKFAAYFFC